MPLTGIADAGGGKLAVVGPRGVAVSAMTSALTRAHSQGRSTWPPSRSKPNRCRWSAISRTSTASRATALERLVFNNRLAMVIVCALVTLVLGYVAATRLALNASFEKMIPQSQPYIKNYLTYQKDLRGLGNAIRVVVENTDGDIFDPRYLEVLKQISDELILTPGVDRAWVKSLWTPAVRWTEVTEEGFRGGAGDAGLLQRLAAERRAAEAEHRALGDRRQPGRQRLQVEHDLRAAARQGARHRQAHRLPRPLEGAGGEDPRQVRARAEPRAGARERGVAADQGPRDRLREADRRADRRAASR